MFPTETSISSLMIEDTSCGVLLLYKAQEWETMIIQQTQGLHWTFSKGHQEPSDVDRCAPALRELREEIGIELNRKDLLKDCELSLSYEFDLTSSVRVRKTLYFFVAVVVDEIRKMDYSLQESEVCGMMWVTLSEALERLTYDGDKSMINRLLEVTVAQDDQKTAPADMI